jgi:hypothetical protein
MRPTGGAEGECQRGDWGLLVEYCFGGLQLLVHCVLCTALCIYLFISLF